MDALLTGLRTKLLERKQMILLSNRDRDLFLTALEGDVCPNRALRKAAERFKRLSAVNNSQLPFHKPIKSGDDHLHLYLPMKAIDKLDF